MTGDRQTRAARFTAALDGPDQIEHRPRDQVMADLEALGLDPRASIMTARKLAASHRSPAEHLLSKLDDGEAIDADIEALEKADFSDIQARIPAGMAASATADARQRAGQPTKIAAFKKPGRRFWGWGGSVVGMAACLLLFVMTRPDQLYQMERPVENAFDDIGTVAETAAIEKTELDDASSLPAEMRAARGTDQPDLVEAKPKPTKRLEQARMSESAANLFPEEQPTALAKKAEPTPPAEARSEVDRSRALEPIRDREADIISAPSVPEPTHQPQAKPASSAKDRPSQVAAVPTPQPSHRPQSKPAAIADRSSNEQGLVTSQKPAAVTRVPLEQLDILNSHNPLAFNDNPGTIQNSLIDLAKRFPDQASALDDQYDLRAVLIVDQKTAPPALMRQAQILPKGDLINRVWEARARLGDRPVLALVKHVRDGREVDAVVTTAEQQAFAEVEEAVGGKASLAGRAEQGFDMIDLPDVR